MARTGRPKKRNSKLTAQLVMRLTPETYQAFSASGTADFWRPIVEGLAVSVESSTAGAADPLKAKEEWQNRILKLLADDTEQKGSQDDNKPEG